MKRALYLLTGLMGLAGLVAVAGLLLPRQHVAWRAAEFRAAPAAVYDVVADFPRYPEWRTGVTEVSIGSREGRPLVTEHGANGVIPYLVEEAQPPSKVLMRIADPDLGFGGTWTFEITPNDSGSELVLTERGEVGNPIVRVMSRLFFSPTETIETYLADLKKRLGE